MDAIVVFITALLLMSVLGTTLVLAFCRRKHPNRHKLLVHWGPEGPKGRHRLGTVWACDDCGKVWWEGRK